MPHTAQNQAQSLQTNTQIATPYHHFLDRPPHWLLHSGISIIFLVMMVVIAFTWFIRYPDKIEALATITSEQPPVEVPALANGVLAKILVKNQEKVQIGQILAVLHSQITVKTVQQLEEWLHSSSDLRVLETRRVEELGELYETFAPLAQNLTETQYLAQKADTQLKNNALQQEIAALDKISITFLRQISTYEKELKLTEKEFKRTTALYKQGAMSDLDRDNAEAKLLQAHRQYDNLQSNVAQNNLKIQQLRAQQREMTYTRTSELAEQHLKQQQLRENLKSALEKWKKQHLIIAPMSGMVSILPDIFAEKYVQANTPICTILPEQGRGRIIAQCQTPALGSGKIQLNDRILIRLDAFPYKEYGMLETTVTNIAVLPQTDQKQNQVFYTIEATLPDTLKTTYHKIIPFRQRMTGTAAIITQDKRLMQRFVDRVRGWDK